MPVPSRSIRRFALAAIVSLGLAACGESPTAVGSPGVAVLESDALADVQITDTTYSSGAVPADPTLWFRRVWVCKIGTSAKFAVSVNGGAATTVDLEDDDCRQVHYYAPDWLGGTDHPAWAGEDTVTVAELLDNPQIELDSIVRDSTHGAFKYRIATLLGTNETTVIVNRSKGMILQFFNSMAGEGEVGQGCTPGYWKQRHHRDSWQKYSPHQKFSSVFENAFPGKTLSDVLKLQGGGLNALGRHAVAALLNSAHSDVNYGMSTEDVIAEFNDAFEGRFDFIRDRRHHKKSKYHWRDRGHRHRHGCGHVGLPNRDEIVALKDEFEALNEMGCPLN